MELYKQLEQIENRIIILRNESILLDRDVACLYQVETKRINEAVKNNPDKFPSGYVFDLERSEYLCLRSKFSTLDISGRGQHVKYYPKAFTEKGLYMLATILKSKVAIQTSIAIIETFTKLRQLSAIVEDIPKAKKELAKKTLLHKGSLILSDLIENETEITDSETSVELTLPLIKIKHSVKRKMKNHNSDFNASN